MPKTLSELELGLYRQDATRYAVELRYRTPDDDAERAPVRGLASFDFDALVGLERDEYGTSLGQMLFADPVIAQEYAKIRAIAQAADATIRLRVLIDSSAPDLHALKWELLNDSVSQRPLATDENVLFSRFLGSNDWRPVRLRPKGDLKALVVVANPSDLASYKPGGRPLPQVDVAGELGRATAALGLIPVTSVVGPGTMARLIDALHDGFDIVYLVCHGALVDGESRLWLEDADGKSDKVAGDDLVSRLRDLDRRPRLIVLASCQSAGSGDDARTDDGGVLAALGPRLAEAGIPAVIAMQGDISMKTVEGMMPVFFKELGRDGQIDRAMAAARGAVRDRHDEWVPALFLRLVSGRIWYVPGFLKPAGGAGEFEGWPALLSNIESGECTPILGSGLLDWLIGPTREVASKWAEMIHYPLASYRREDLPQVAQYLSVVQDRSYLWKTLRKTMADEALRRFGDQIPASVPRDNLDEMLKAAAAKYRADEPNEPHAVLARLPLPLYISTNPDGLLADALSHAEISPGTKKVPKVELCAWNDINEWPASVFEKTPGSPSYRPTEKEPLVYHLFGQLGMPRSLVLTEDNYFDFLIGATRDKDLIPPFVLRMLTKSSLMFLGFRLDEWDFRVLYRIIMSLEGGSGRRDYSHVAVQLDPEEGHNLNPERARKYLQRYFQDAQINIYWGNVNDFARELAEEWTRWKAKLS